MQHSIAWYWKLKCRQNSIYLHLNQYHSSTAFPHSVEGCSDIVCIACLLVAISSVRNIYPDARCNDDYCDWHCSLMMLTWCPALQETHSIAQIRTTLFPWLACTLSLSILAPRLFGMCITKGDMLSFLGCCLEEKWEGLLSTSPLCHVTEWRKTSL